MSRVPQATDFTVPVEGVGKFVFAKRTMADEIAIQREYSGMLQGVEPTQQLDNLASWMAVLRTLTVRAPEDWDIDEMDPLDPETYEKLLKVFTAVREAENSFRRGKKVAPEAASA
ncbi:hypothetical protein [Tardiphaga sp. 862_B3_N1_1]|uniref:hypothetical protein n=1 Tax=Tardiphaga sp. 862_B3_N1_1 TaxID=3240763 RepID=UPI003F8A7657